MGFLPTAMVATTLLVVVSITETVPSSRLVTYARLVAEFTAMLQGLLPTAMVVTTVFGVAVPRLDVGVQVRASDLARVVLAGAKSRAMRGIRITPTMPGVSGMR